MDDLQQVLVSLNEIESILTEQDFPEPNPKALSRIRLLAAQMSGPDPYIAEKASRISALAAVFYSDKRHAEHQGGADRLLAEIAYDLPNRIRAQVEYLRRIQREQSNTTDA